MHSSTVLDISAPIITALVAGGGVALVNRRRNNAEAEQTVVETAHKVVDMLSSELHRVACVADARLQTIEELTTERDELQAKLASLEG